MTSDPPNTSKPNDDPIGQLRAIDAVTATQNADSYDDFIAELQSLIQRHVSIVDPASEQERVSLDDFERLARNAMMTLVQHEQMLDQDGDHSTANDQGNATLFVGRNGTIVSANPKATQRYRLTIGQAVNITPIELENGELVGDLCDQVRNAPSESNTATLRRATLSDTEQAVLCVCSRVNDPDGDVPLAMLILIETVWTDDASQMLMNGFSLTKSEAMISTAFIQGQSLKAIASERGRSYNTIRNQFQSVLEKTGSANQTDFMRLALSFSYISHQFTGKEPPKETIAHTGEAILMLRPNRRRLDVVLYGDRDGEAVISFPSIFGHPITPAIDASFQEAGIMVIGVARPGFGKTTDGTGPEAIKIFADDLRALLDNFGIERCPFMGRATSSRMLFQLGSTMPERMSSGLIANAVMPPSYIQSTDVMSRWTRALIPASTLSPVVASLIIRSGHRLMKSMQTEAFLKRMYKGAAIDCSIAQNTEVCESLRAGVDHMTQQGLGAGTRDLVDGFVDWTDDVRHSQVPITLLHGTEDPHVPIAATQKIAADFPDTVRVSAVEGGGGLLNFTHPQRVLEEVEALVYSKTGPHLPPPQP